MSIFPINRRLFTTNIRGFGIISLLIAIGMGLVILLVVALSVLDIKEQTINATRHNRIFDLRNSVAKVLSDPLSWQATFLKAPPGTNEQDKTCFPGSDDGDTDCNLDFWFNSAMPDSIDEYMRTPDDKPEGNLKKWTCTRARGKKRYGTGLFGLAGLPLYPEDYRRGNYCCAENVDLESCILKLNPELKGQYVPLEIYPPKVRAQGHNSIPNFKIRMIWSKGKQTPEFFSLRTINTTVNRPPVPTRRIRENSISRTHNLPSPSPSSSPSSPSVSTPLKTVEQTATSLKKPYRRTKNPKNMRKYARELEKQIKKIDKLHPGKDPSHIKNLYKKTCGKGNNRACQKYRHPKIPKEKQKTTNGQQRGKKDFEKTIKGIMKLQDASTSTGNPSAPASEL